MRRVILDQFPIIQQPVPECHRSTLFHSAGRNIDPDEVKISNLYLRYSILTCV